MHEVPDWLANALSADPRPPIPLSDPADLTDHVPAAGEIVPLLAMDQRGIPTRLVLVLDSDRHTRSAQVVLLSPELDLWTDSDILLPAADSGLRFDLLLETELLGTVFFCQLGAPVSRLSTEQFMALAGAQRTPGVLADRRGLPIRDELDQRWVHKQAEAEVFEALVRPCRDELLDPPVLDVDPDEFARALRSHDEAACRALLADEHEAVGPLPIDLLPDLSPLSDPLDTDEVSRERVDEHGTIPPNAIGEDLEALVLEFCEAALLDDSPAAHSPPDEEPELVWDRGGASEQMSELVQVRARQGRHCLRWRRISGVGPAAPTAAQVGEHRLQILLDERAAE